MTKQMRKRQKKLEYELAKTKHTLELIRTIVPVAVLILQVVILSKVI